MYTFTHTSVVEATSLWGASRRIWGNYYYMYMYVYMYMYMYIIHAVQLLRQDASPFSRPPPTPPASPKAGRCFAACLKFFGALVRGHSKRGLSKSSKVREQIRCVCCTFAKPPFAMSPKRGSRNSGGTSCPTMLV